MIVAKKKNMLVLIEVMIVIVIVIVIVIDCDCDCDEKYCSNSNANGHGNLICARCCVNTGTMFFFSFLFFFFFFFFFPISKKYKVSGHVFVNFIFFGNNSRFRFASSVHLRHPNNSALLFMFSSFFEKNIEKWKKYFFVEIFDPQIPENKNKTNKFREVK